MPFNGKENYEIFYLLFLVYVVGIIYLITFALFVVIKAANVVFRILEIRKNDKEKNPYHAEIL